MTSLKLPLLVLALLAAAPVVARGQACCAGAGTLAAGRLMEEERWAVGLTLRAAHQLGQHDGDGAWRGTGDGYGEQGFEQQLFGVRRLLRRLQLSATVPLVQTRRTVPALRDAGAGLGDLRAGLRWDLRPPGFSRFPGVALLGGASLPTGRGAEAATHALGADATGLGTATAQAGVALEQTTGTWLWQLAGQYLHTFAHSTGGFTVDPGAQWQASGAFGRGFSNGGGVALAASVRRDGPTSLNGSVLEGSERLMPLVGLSAGRPLRRGWRLQLSMQATPPVSRLGRGASGFAAGTLSVLRVGY